MAQTQFWWVSDSVSQDWLTGVTRLSVLGDQTDQANGDRAVKHEEWPISSLGPSEIPDLQFR